MKNNKINFFESPNPSHFNLNNLRQIQERNPQEHVFPEQRLFSTPLRLNTQIITSPSFNVNPYFSHPNRLQRRRGSEEVQDDAEEYMDNQQPIQESHHGIQQKIEFSQAEEEQQLLLHITPKKNVMMEDPEIFENTTLPKKIAQIYMTPGAESRTAERGLKRLAAQAYRFVNQQKKTTYKDVAKKLISQLNEEVDLDINLGQTQQQKRGQMNIKRRVYDALNVLIAVGVFKRIGHKIYGRKMEAQESICNKNIEKQRQKMREKQMQNQLNHLKMQYQRRQKLINAKKKIQQDLKLKMHKYKELVNKNYASGHPKDLQKIPFPMVVVCRKENSQAIMKYEEVAKHEQNVEQCLKVWQDRPDTFCVCFNCPEQMQIMGQLDMLAYLPKSEVPFKKSVKIEKPKRKRR